MYVDKIYMLWNMIELENVSKSYSTGAPAIKGISLKIENGEFVFI